MAWVTQTRAWPKRAPGKGTPSARRSSLATKKAAPKRAPKKTAKAAPKRAPKKAAKTAPKRAPKKAAPKRAAKRPAVYLVASQLPRTPANSIIPHAPVTSIARKPRLNNKRLAIVGISSAGIGILAYLLLAAKKIQSPAPSTPSTTPATPATNTSGAQTPTQTTPASPPATEPETPIAQWSDDGKTLNMLTGYHRAKASELGPQMKASASSFLKQPVGTIHYVTLDKGTHYAVAVEGSHNNHPEWGATNKGVSMFIRDTANT